MECANDEDDSNSRDETTRRAAAAILKEKKIKLRNEIRELKELNFQIECSMNISKFGDIKHLLTTSEPTQSSSSKRIPDIETEYVDELFKLAGMRCTKFLENEYVFSFSSPGNLIGTDAYAVQITNASKEPKIGKWVMPMSTNMKSILLETPLEDAMDLKPFLANCKHHIDCHANRLQQYNELKPIMDNLEGCSMQSNLGHTVMILKFFNMQDLESEESHNITLYLIYESERVRPHKMKLEASNSTKLADTLVNKLKRYFKYFKCYDLKKAFKETMDAKDTPVAWREGEDENDLDSSDNSASSSEENFITRRRKNTQKSTQRRRNTQKSTRRGLKRKATETSLRSNQSENREQSSHNSDSGQVDDPQPSSLDPVDNRDATAVKNKGKRQAPKKKRIEAANASSAPESSKKKSKPTKNREKNVKPSANTSNTNLRQSTLRFEKRAGAYSTQLISETPLPEKTPSAGGSTMIRKSKSNSTQLANREFGTSTPVPHLNRQKKQFVNVNDSEVSPIKSATNTRSIEKQLKKKKTE